METFSCNRSVPVLHFHGLDDPIVPFDGCNATVGPQDCKGLFNLVPGTIAAMPHVADYIADWRTRNGITEAGGKSSFENGTVSCTAWGELANNVTLCKIQGGGHS